MNATVVFFSVLLLPIGLTSCKQNEATPSAATIKELQLKKGTPISCGPEEQQLGFVAFPISGTKQENKEFLLGLKLLHSFEYDAAEQVFAGIIDQYPSCAMAYWGVAMSNFHPLWAPPTEAEVKRGYQAAHIAASLPHKSDMETGFIEAIGAYYNNWQQTDHRKRCSNFEQAMERLYTQYPDQREVAVFYALALNAAADPADKSLARQKKAGSILQALYPGAPNHPGIVHYLIHAYDAPELAAMAVPAAKKYAEVAPSSAHALHMPSHIFTRLGHWDESIASNMASVDAAQCYAQTAGLKGHWDEELHGMDYLVYAYLQKGDNRSAKEQLDYLKSMKQVKPVNFKVAYAFAAIPSRYLLENKQWKEAANLSVDTDIFSWKDYPWQNAIIHFTRLLGSVNTNNPEQAERELDALKNMHHALLQQKDAYKADQVAIQIKASEAWIQLQQGKKQEALVTMQMAADMEDKTEKHPVTPSEVLPAKELLADMYIVLQRWPDALAAHEANLAKHPNRFNSLYGAGLAAESSGKREIAAQYYSALNKIVSATPTDRPEVKAVNRFLQTGQQL